MSAIAMVGSITLVLSQDTLERLLKPLVALAAGSLLGGAFLHMMPEAIDELGNTTTLWLWFLGGYGTFFVLEQVLHWHHCHRAVSNHRPLGHLILVADGLHNFIGGVAVASAFFIDHRVGIITWCAAAAHEIPQELGDFGILVNSGWSRKSALVFNLLSGLTFLLGGLVAYALAGSVDVVVLVPFAAGNFAYIGERICFRNSPPIRCLRPKSLPSRPSFVGSGFSWRCRSCSGLDAPRSVSRLVPGAGVAFHRPARRHHFHFEQLRRRRCVQRIVGMHAGGCLGRRGEGFGTRR